MYRKRNKWLIFVQLIIMIISVVFGSYPAFPKNQNSGPVIDLFCPDITIKEALLTTAFQADVEMVFLQDVKGKVNLRKENIPFEKALDLILKGTGIPWSVIDGVYYVGNPPSGSPVAVKMSSPETLPLQNITSKELMEQLPQFANNLIPDAPHSIILNGSETIKAEMKKEINKLDHPKEHIQVKSIIAEVSNDSLEDIAVDISAGGDESLSIGPLASIGGSFERLERIEAMLRLLESEGKAVIHSESEIMVLEGEQGKVWAGKSAYYMVETESTAGTTTSLETVELGSGLTVIPYYIGQQKIKINVEAQLKSLENQASDLPVILSRDSKTVVTMTENQPVFIAGVETVSTRQIRKKLFEKKAQSDLPDRMATNSQLVIFLEAERKNLSDSPLVMKLKGEDIKMEQSSSRRTSTEYQISPKVMYGSLIIPEYQISPHYWLGADLNIQSGKNIAFYGELLKATDKNLWLGKFNLEYLVHNDEDNSELVNLGIGMKAFWGELQESAFFAYVKDIRQVEDNLLTYFSIGMEYAADYKNAYFASLGVFYHEEDWLLHAEATYQWNNNASNWIMILEGKYRLDKNSFFTIGYRDILSGSPIEPYDNFDFRGLYAGVSFQF